MKKQIISVLLAFTFALGMVFINKPQNAEADSGDPPGGVYYDIALCWGLGQVNAACTVPTMNGPCSFSTSCDPGTND